MSGARTLAFLPSSAFGDPVIMADVYTIILRDKTFTLTRDYFTNYFLGGNQTHRQLRLGRHPAIFALVLEHLSGYEILPDPTTGI